MRRAARTDGNQSTIVDALRDAHATVQVLSSVGDGCPDLVAGFRGRTFLLEVKDPSQPPCRRRLTPEQEKWHREWRGQVAVVETVDEALRAIGAIR